jgi:hypothetical protein
VPVISRKSILKIKNRRWPLEQEVEQATRLTYEKDHQRAVTKEGSQ